MIDERGLSYAEERPKPEHHVYFCVLSDEDLKTEADDIIVYIELALQHLEDQLNKIQKSFL
ncbi:MAG: hypothetical protein IJ274_04865, partial [Lachnospiraceae bacterium]|nr:hypothetical protein [Lachnospiraceae bacterium]